MSELIMIVDGSCASCNKLGRELTTIDGVRAIPSDSREALELGVASMAPCLVEIRDGSPARIRKGWAMRLRLARHLGWRRASHWFVLLRAELSANDARAGGPTRRTLLLGSLLGVAAGALGAQTASAASTSPSVRTLSSTELSAELASLPPAAASARKTAKHGYVLGSGQYETLALVDEAGSATLVPRHFSDQTLVLSGEGSKLLYSRIDGTPLVSLSALVVAGKKTVAATPSSQSTAGTVTPDDIGTFSICFAGCLGREVDFDCIFACATLNTGYCLLCAGYLGIVCADDCRRYW